LIKNAAVAQVVETELREHRVRLGQKVTKEMWVHRANKGRKESKVYKESRVFLEQTVLMAQMVTRGLRASKERPDLRVTKEMSDRKEKLVYRAYRA
jgi:hypothetical protein